MAININRVYTRGGDEGKTSLVGGARVDKDCRKLESYGTVDELLCMVGMARTLISPVGKPQDADTAAMLDLEVRLRKVQNRLFDVGSILATPAGETYTGMPEITETDSTDLENEMDEMQKSLQPLKSFVLPGGTLPNAALHQCRVVCRRAEREIIRLSREEKVDPRIIKYINRLSDYFFVMSRYASHLVRAEEFLWEYGLSKNAGEKSSEAET